MALSEESKTTLEILEAMYGRLLTIEGPTKFRDMTPGERDALIEPHLEELQRDVEALDLSIDIARRDGIADVLSAFRTVEGLDPDVVDELMESFLSSRREERRVNADPSDHAAPPEDRRW